MVLNKKKLMAGHNMLEVPMLEQLSRETPEKEDDRPVHGGEFSVKQVSTTHPACPHLSRGSTSVSTPTLVRLPARFLRPVAACCLSAGRILCPSLAARMLTLSVNA